MKYEKLTKNNLLFILSALILLTLSLFFTLKYHKTAFPGQSITFNLTKPEALDTARTFLQNNNIQPDQYFHNATTFNYPELSKIFIEKELGVEKSHRFFSETFNIWQWSVRFFNSLEKEEVYVSFSTDGELRYFDHVLKEETALSSLSMEAAEQTARNFIDKNTERNLDNWELKDKATKSQKARVDYSFTFQKKNVEIYGAHFEIQITVKGDKVGYYEEYLKVPEYWQRDYKKLRSQNQTTATIAMAFLILLGLSSVVVFIYTTIRGKINLKVGLIFGIATFSIFLISQLNMLPLNFYYYNTSKSISGFYTDRITGIVIGALLYGAAVFFLASAGDSLYKKMCPAKNGLLRSFTWKGMQTREFFLSTLTGFVLAFVFIVFQIFFYIIAEKLGAWSPASVNYSEIINTKFPWIFILFAGFIPAVTEEFCFRLYGIPLFDKFTKSKLFAVILTAIIWGFAHSNYPNQPFWIRGVEVSLFGIATGYVFISFGIVATLIWHYTVDAFLTILMFANTGNTSILIPSVIAGSIALFLLLYSLFHYFKNRGFLSSEELLNRSDAIGEREEIKPLPEVHPRPHVSYSLPAYSKNQIYFILVALIVFISSFLLPVKRLGEYINYTVSEEEAIETAKEFVDSRGLDPNRFETASSIISDCDEPCLKYITTHTTIDSANFIFANYLPNIVSYKIRLYQEHEKEEFIVYVHPMDNVVTGFNHMLSEDAMSYNLSKELALIRVEQFIAKQQYQIDDFRLVESFSNILPNRTDHTFVYESKYGFIANIDEAKLRLTLKVKGDELGYFKSWYKVPENWLLEINKENNFDSIRKILGMLLLPLFLLVLLLKHKESFNFMNIPWKSIIYTSAGLFLILFIYELVNLKTNFIYYDTTWSQFNFVISLMFSRLINLLLTALLFFLLLLVGAAYYGNHNIVEDLKENQSFGFDVLLSSLLSTFGLIAIIIGIKYVAGNNPSFITSPDINIPQYLVQNFFILKILVKAIMIGITFAVLYYSIVSIIFRNKFFLIALLAIIPVLLPASIDTMPAFLFSYFSLLMIILWLYICQRFFLWKNLLAYLIFAISFMIIYYSYDLIRTGSTKAIVGGAFLIGILLVMVIWLLIKDKTNWYERLLS